MLTALQLQQQRRRRTLPSLKQQYHEYILQRIESHNCTHHPTLKRAGGGARCMGCRKGIGAVSEAAGAQPETHHGSN